MGKCFEAMEVDSLSSSHPVSTPVENPIQIQEMFDDVSYDKVSQIPGIDAVGGGEESIAASSAPQLNLLVISGP